jgi:hypothetical protein
MERERGKKRGKPSACVWRAPHTLTHSLTHTHTHQQCDALEAAATVRASEDTAYLECDHACRPLTAAFVARYASFAVTALDAALARAGRPRTRARSRQRRAGWAGLLRTFCWRMRCWRATGWWTVVRCVGCRTCEGWPSPSPTATLAPAHSSHPLFFFFSPRPVSAPGKRRRQVEDRKGLLEAPSTCQCVWLRPALPCPLRVEGEGCVHAWVRLMQTFTCTLCHSLAPCSCTSPPLPAKRQQTRPRTRTSRLTWCLKPSSGLTAPADLVDAALIIK